MYDVLLSKSENKSVKDLIVHILSMQWPLSAKKIYNIIKNKYNYNVSYQAVHKSLKILIDQGILTKKDKEFLISIEWIDNLKEFSEKVTANYKNKAPLFLPGLKEFKQEGETQIFVFNSLKEADDYRKRLQREFINDKTKKYPYVGTHRHLISPVVYSEWTLKSLNLLPETKTKCYIVCSGNTEIDGWCANYYRSSYFDVKVGIEFDETCDTMVLGDIITQMYIPDSILEYINNLYAKTKDIKEINVPQFFKDVYESKNAIKFIVFRNPAIAEQLRNRILEYFERDKIAIFDIDGSLVDGFLLYNFVEYLVREKLFDRIVYKNMLNVLAKYKNGKISYDIFAKSVIDIYANGLKGKDVKDIENAAKFFVSENKIKLYRYAKDLFSLVSNRRKTIFLTVTPKEVVIALKSIFPFDDFIAMSFEKKGGVYTGEIKRDLTSKDKKKKELEKYIETRKIDMKDSVGFGDTVHDMAFLETVAHPIVLNPDKAMQKFANKNNWFIYKKNDAPGKLLKKVKSILTGY